MNSFLLSRQKNLNEMAKKVAELFVEVLAVAGVSIFSTMLMPLPQDIFLGEAVNDTHSRWKPYNKLASLPPGDMRNLGRAVLKPREQRND